MNETLRKQMEEMATQYAHMGVGKHSETEKIRRYNGYATGFTACSEVYEAKLDALKEENRKIEGKYMELSIAAKLLLELCFPEKKMTAFMDSVHRTKIGQLEKQLEDAKAEERARIKCDEAITRLRKALSDSSQGDGK